MTPHRLIKARPAAYKVSPIRDPVNVLRPLACFSYNGGVETPGTRTPSTPPSPRATWPETPWSLIRRARSAPPADRRAAVGRLLELYYVPVRRFFARVL